MQNRIGWVQPAYANHVVVSVTRPFHDLWNRTRSILDGFYQDIEGFCSFPSREGLLKGGNDIAGALISKPTAEGSLPSCLTCIIIFAPPGGVDRNTCFYKQGFMDLKNKQ